MSAPAHSVLRHRDCDAAALARLLARYGLSLRLTPDRRPIPGSFWGGEEAGLVGACVILRADTPLHSILHEACHFICMDADRRARLDTDAGGDHDEENAVCYLQILLSDELPGCGRDRMLADMDAWGYSFRLGAARAWFERDADDAREWLLRHGLLTAGGGPAWVIRGAGSERHQA